MKPRSPGVGRDRGSVLLETAFAIPVLAAIALALVWVVSLGAAYAYALDTAQTAARAVSRGAPAPLPHSDERLDVIHDAGLVDVTVTRDVSAPVPILQGLVITVTAHAVAAEEVP